jgi:putative transposase
METLRGGHKRISLRRQCELLSVPRSSLYYEPIQEKLENIKMMDLMDKHLIKHPTEGVVSMVYWLRERGYPVGPKIIRRLS